MGAAKGSRAALIGLGGWGCRTLAHLWPRLRLADERRTLIIPNLTPIHHTVSFALVMPDDTGQITIARPRPGRWDTPTFAETPWHALSDMPRQEAQHSRAWREETYQRLRDNVDILEVFAPPAGLPAACTRFREGDATSTVRKALLHTLAAHESAITQQLIWIMDQARIDRGEPTAEISRLTVYVLASLAEDVTSILIWPLAAMIRQAVGNYTPIEIIGLFQADSFAAPPDRLYELASIHLALQEMTILESADNEQQTAVRAILPSSQWLEALGTHPLDYRYLIGREKVGGTMAEGEGEIITMVGNALEAFLLSDADRFLSERLAPDLPTLQEMDSYSSLGAASIYVPVELMRARSRDQVRLQLLRDLFLAPLLPEQSQHIEELARTLGRGLLSVVQLEQALIDSRHMVLGAEAARTYPDASAGPFVPIHLRPSELQPPLSGTEGLGMAARVEAIQQHFAQLEGSRLPRWRQELLVRAGVMPPPEVNDELVPVRVKGEEEATEGAELATAGTPAPGQPARPDGQARVLVGVTAVNHLLAQMDRFLLDLVREGGRGGLRMALHCAEKVADWVRQESVGLSAQRSQLAIPPSLRHRSDSAQADRLIRTMERWSLLQNHPGWAYLALLVLSLIAATFAVRAAGTGPGDFQVAGLVRLLVGAVLLSGVTTAGALMLTRRQLNRLVNRLVEVKAATINRDLNDLIYDLTVKAHVALYEKVQERVGYLQRALAELESERVQLATLLARPMTADSSFVRTAVLDNAIYDGIWARARRWVSGGISPRLWANGNSSPDELDVAWRDTVEGIVAEPTLFQLEHRPALSWTDGTGTRTPLTEAISSAIARYAAVVSQPYLPPGASVESSLLRLAQQQGQDSAQTDTGWRLDDLCLRARPFIGLEETESSLNTLVSIDLAAVPHTMSKWINRQTGAALRVHPVSSSDPFSIIVVRTLHGLLARSLPQLRRFAAAFRALNPEERDRLVVNPALAGKAPLPPESDGHEEGQPAEALDVATPENPSSPGYS